MFVFHVFIHMSESKKKKNELFELFYAVLRAPTFWLFFLLKNSFVVPVCVLNWGGNKEALHVQSLLFYFIFFVWRLLVFSNPLSCTNTIKFSTKKNLFSALSLAEPSEISSLDTHLF